MGNEAEDEDDRWRWVMREARGGRWLMKGRWALGAMGGADGKNG